MNAALPLLLTGLLGFNSCLPRPDDSEPPPAATICENTVVLGGDVDGDGHGDRILHSVREESAGDLAVCFSDGRYSETPAAFGAPLGTIDVGFDGTTEVLVGEVRGDTTTYRVLRWDGARLRPIAGVTLAQTDDDAATRTHAFGCAPPNRLVQARIDWARRTATVTTYEVTGFTAKTTVRTLDVPADAHRAQHLARLVPVCGNVELRGLPH